MAAEKTNRNSKELTLEQRANKVQDELYKLLPMIQASTAFSTMLPRVFNMFVESRMKTNPELVEFLEDFSSTVYAFIQKSERFSKSKSKIKRGYADSKKQDRMQNSMDPKIVNRMEGFIYELMDKNILQYLTDNPRFLEFFEDNINMLNRVNYEWNNYLFFREQVDNVLITTATQDDVSRLIHYNHTTYVEMLNNLTEYRDFFADTNVRTFDKARMLFPQSVLIIPKDTEATNEAVGRAMEITSKIEDFCRKYAGKNNLLFRKAAKQLILTYEAQLVADGGSLPAGYISIKDPSKYMQRFDKGSIPIAGGLFTGAGHFLHTMQVDKTNLMQMTRKKYALSVVKLTKNADLPPKVKNEIARMPELAKIEATTLDDLTISGEKIRAANRIAQRIKPHLSKMHTQLHQLQLEMKTMKDTGWGLYSRSTPDLKLLAAEINDKLPPIKNGGDWYGETAKLHKAIIEQMFDMRSRSDDPRDVNFFNKHLKEMTHLHLPAKPVAIPKLPKISRM